MNREWKIFVKNISKFVAESDSKTSKAIKHTENMVGIVEFASWCMGVNIKEACQNQINIVVKNMKRLSEEDFKKLFILCDRVGVKVGE